MNKGEILRLDYPIDLVKSNDRLHARVIGLQIVDGELMLIGEITKSLVDFITVGNVFYLNPKICAPESHSVESNELFWLSMYDYERGKDGQENY